MINKKLHNKNGQTIVEYALILVFIAVVAISVLLALGSSTATANQQQSQSAKQVQHKVTVYDENPPTVYYTDGDLMAHQNFISFYVQGKEVDISAASRYKVEVYDNN